MNGRGTRAVGNCQPSGRRQPPVSGERGNERSLRAEIEPMLQIADLELLGDYLPAVAIEGSRVPDLFPGCLGFPELRVVGDFGRVRQPVGHGTPPFSTPGTLVPAKLARPKAKTWRAGAVMPPV